MTRSRQDALPRRTKPASPIYEDWYRTTDFRERPDLYEVGRGEQGVLIAEPYKSEIGAHWRFRTPAAATESSAKILSMFHAYLASGDFAGADMARKFLQMGWTRARRYANHPSGKKYGADGVPTPQDPRALDSEKSQAAAIFKAAYDKARADPEYLRMGREREAAKLPREPKSK